MKILIVEDMAPVSRLLSTWLGRWGHNTRVADTGKKALEMVEKEMYDLILLDIYLPDAVGYDLIPQMKRAWSGMEIITMTGRNSRDLERRVRGQGILYYMVKPVDTTELKTIIDHLDGKRGNPRQDHTATQEA